LTFPAVATIIKVRLFVRSTPRTTDTLPMSIWNKILFVLIFLTSLVFMYLGAKTLKAHEHWRSKVLAFEAALEKTEQQIEDAQYAESDEGVIADMGIEQLKRDLHGLLVVRGRAWYNTEPQQIDAESGVVNVKIDTPSEDDLPGRHGIAENTVIYIFEEADVEAPLGQGGGRYLGEFIVTGINPGEITARPLGSFDARQLDRLANSSSPWSLYDVMPVDSHDVLADVDDERLRSILPETVAEQYIRDMEPATAEEIEELGLPGKVVDKEGNPVAAGETGIYKRPLRDYEVIFRGFDREDLEWKHAMTATLTDTEYARGAKEAAEQDVEFRRRQVEEHRSDLAKMSRRRDLIAKHRTALERKLAEISRAAQEIRTNNRQLASRIAQIQIEAQRRIDERTRRMAQRAEGS